MDSDNKDKTMYWIRTTRLGLFNGFGQQASDYLKNSNNNEKTI